MDARSRLGERIGRKHEIGQRQEETYPLPYMTHLRSTGFQNAAAETRAQHRCVLWCFGWTPEE